MRQALTLGVGAVILCGFAADAAAQMALSSNQTALLCAPPATLTRPVDHAVRIVGGQDTEPRILYGAGELVVVNTGTAGGIQLGQVYLVRRGLEFGTFSVDASRALTSVETTGTLHIVAVDERTAIGRLDLSCDGVMTGDYLEPFAATAVVDTAESSALGEPDFSRLGHVLDGVRETWLGGAGNFMNIDRGSADGLQPGARVAIFRDLGSPGVPLTSIGEAVVVSASEKRAVVQILASRTAVERGDFVALRTTHPPPTTPQ